MLTGKVLWSIYIGDAKSYVLLPGDLNLKLELLVIELTNSKFNSNGLRSSLNPNEAGKNTKTKILKGEKC